MLNLASGIISLLCFIANIIILILLVKAALEIWKMPFSKEKRLLTIIILLVTNWVGVCVYYFYAKNKLVEWLK